jgi:hypothetical protein
MARPARSAAAAAGAAAASAARQGLSTNTLADSSKGTGEGTNRFVSASAVNPDGSPRRRRRTGKAGLTALREMLDNFDVRASPSPSPCTYWESIDVDEETGDIVSQGRLRGHTARMKRNRGLSKLGRRGGGMSPTGARVVAGGFNWNPMSAYTTSSRAQSAYHHDDELSKTLLKHLAHKTQAHHPSNGESDIGWTNAVGWSGECHQSLKLRSGGAPPPRRVPAAAP